MGKRSKDLKKEVIDALKELRKALEKGKKRVKSRPQT